MSLISSSPSLPSPLPQFAFVRNAGMRTDLQTLPLKSFFPAVTHFFTRLGPTYRRHANVLDGFLKAKLAASRVKAKELGMSGPLILNASITDSKERWIEVKGKLVLRLWS